MWAIGNGVLSEIYGLDSKDVRKCSNGAWSIEQFRDTDMTYTARILEDGSTYVTVDTNAVFPKTVCTYCLSVGKRQIVGESGMTKSDRQIAALEFAIQYVPGSDENHSHSVLLDMLAELRSRKRKGD